METCSKHLNPRLVDFAILVTTASVVYFSFTSPPQVNSTNNLFTIVKFIILVYSSMLTKEKEPSHRDYKADLAILQNPIELH